MRSIWSGSIGFGLVNIPVKIFSAIHDSTLDLDMLDKRDHSTINYARINSNTGKVVPWANIVKGYKYNDEYVVLTDEDFEKASPEKTKLIEIDEFVKAEEIDSIYYDTPYYLEAAKGGERSYALLLHALKQSGKIAIGTYVMRNKENICALRPYDNMLLLLKMRFAEEIKDYSDLNIPGQGNIKPAELKMALSLINQLTPKKFNFGKYKDTYDAELMKLIKLKAKGSKIPQPRFKIVHNKTKDLMSQLKASLEEKKRKAS